MRFTHNKTDGWISISDNAILKSDFLLKKKKKKNSRNGPVRNHNQSILTPLGIGVICFYIRQHDKSTGVFNLFSFYFIKIFKSDSFINKPAYFAQLV